MSLISDFELVWKSYEDKLTSYVAKNSMNKKFTDADDFNSYYKMTINMWNDELKAQGSFLNKWNKQDFCREFMKVLNTYSFENLYNQSFPSPIPYAFITLAITILGGIIGYLLPADIFLKKYIGNILVIVIAMIVFAITGGSIIKALYENSVIQKCNDCANTFYSQIQILHDKLKDICKKY